MIILNYYNIFKQVPTKHPKMYGFKKFKTKIHILYNKLEIRFRKKSYSPKVFCVGYSKTGTTSLGKSFEMLGFRNCSYYHKGWTIYYPNKQYEKIINYAAKFDSFDDLPWLTPIMIPKLDKAFPNSKFVYLIRDEKSWKNSYYNFNFKKFGTYPDDVEAAWQKFNRHKKFVFGYFENRPKDFIVLDVRDKLGFKKLADFLGKTTTREEFPHYNKT